MYASRSHFSQLPLHLGVIFKIHSTLGHWILLRIFNARQELICVFLVPLEQVVRYQPLWRLAQPLEEREITELICLENFEHLNWLIANVLDKMAHIARDDSHITRRVVKGPRSALGRKNSDARLSTDEKVPLVSIWVPVHLAQRTRLDDGMRGGDGLGDGEILGVGDADLTARGNERILRKHLVCEIVLGLLGVLACRALLVDGAWVRALENVLFAGGEMCKDFGGEVKVLGDNRLGGMC